ncbi:exodeoxyribonuclease VII large subunit [Heyndrickxia ginsengihumi]|uniref:exodeoxyribonuclease VII large subunit n=1 Tax=Heyndrickxia ginsengihumi TaxID=363870 RepID=UPI0004725AAC|nr:exodeoxyribonuclease VII large subunit [Heyndrickxia ginsengihumi]MBE6182963.1 exodeoxyribonuclease VII large subunit [Bacillus sp. (in: firmicutes)]MCM3022814.1 exodeoxyribonuclease VII large subunit [Heyndrickxia ginsengihumi]
MNSQPYLSVQALTKYIKRKFDADPYMLDIFVKGEISNFKRHSSGHMYFTLKDDKARILAVMFSSANKILKFEPENGMNVLIRGSISVYEASGNYQLYVKEMQPDGIGELYLAYEQLRAQLEKEGLFAPEHKQKIPPYPHAVGVITSPTGAAVRDIITTIRRRFPIAKIILYPALVQGGNAAPTIVRAIERVNQNEEVDVLIVGRGGGSIEELWAFNEESVARAIFQSTIPVISAVGHETDFTIADFVADLRAPTPTAAAEMAVPHIEELIERILNRKTRLIRSVREKVHREKNRLEYIERSPIFRNPHRLFQQQIETVDRLLTRLQREIKHHSLLSMRTYQELNRRLINNRPTQRLQLEQQRYAKLNQELTKQMKSILKDKQHQFAKNLSALEALSPLKVMERGYSLAYTKDQTLIKSTKQVQKDDDIQIQLSDGLLWCNIKQIERGNGHV